MDSGGNKIKIKLHNYPEPLFFEALKYESEVSGERVIAYFENDLHQGFARRADNELGVSEIILFRPHRRPYISQRRIRSTAALALDPLAIDSLELIALDQGQEFSAVLPDDFINLVVDRSEPSGSELDPVNDLQPGHYYIATDQQGVSGRIYIRNIHNSPTPERRLLEVVFADGSQRIVVSDNFVWRADNES
jgi:hypothetical protein